MGAPTEVEMKEKNARVEDAPHSTRAAVEGLSGDNEDQNVGIALLRRAKEASLFTLNSRALLTQSDVMKSYVSVRPVKKKRCDSREIHRFSYYLFITMDLIHCND